MDPQEPTSSEKERKKKKNKERKARQKAKKHNAPNPDNSSSSLPASPPTPEELESKMRKKQEKALEKESKKLKAAQKVEAAKLAQRPSDAPESGISKRSRKVADAEVENPEDFYEPQTPAGDKKSLSCKMAKTYRPSAVEKSWYEWWEKSNFFMADPDSSKQPFAMVFPPPNVTGELHIGHALTAAIQDAVIRWRRMSGYNTLWIPGTDHAGIATQVVVEKKIMRERALTRHDVGRESFIAEVFHWKNQCGGTILNQLRRLGASLDWSREYFTMDEKRSVAVAEAFVRLHKEGLIYRDVRLVKWDCALRTTISKEEAKKLKIKARTLVSVPGYEEPVEFGVLTLFAYPLEGGLGEIVVATTRVETMLGDTAIAIHPDDPRYQHVHEKHVIHPFNGRKLPVVCDAKYVDVNYGTGAVKITPAHDETDFKVGKQHNLEFINIFNDDGTINSYGGPEFAGMPRYKARVAVIEALKEKGLYRGDKDNDEMTLEICSRSGDVLEQLIKPQWYVQCKSMTGEALDAVFDDVNPRMEIIPEQYVAVWKSWLENIEDWCISRQLWWGHRIPAYYAILEDDEFQEVGAYSDHWVVAKSKNEAMEEASRKFGKSFELYQDPDVLDTWFSSALLPLSALGWPDSTKDLKAFYPLSFFETGADILFFWVARIVMLVMKLADDLPFRKVYLHAMVRDSRGRKVSKSLGNGVDPLAVINGISLSDLLRRLEDRNLDPDELKSAKECQAKDFPDGIPECGADALRFALVSYTAQVGKINLDIQRVVGYRQWCNKLWNAVRFALSRLGEGYLPPSEIMPGNIPFICKWILSVLNKAISKTVLSLESNEFSDAASVMYAWWQFQLCDIFIEAIKPYFVGDDASFRSSAKSCLWFCLDNGLRLLHPFMPFITEELWQRLPSRKDDSMRKESIMISEYPSAVEAWADDEVELEMNAIESVVKSLRSLRTQLTPDEQLRRRAGFVRCRTDEACNTMKKHRLLISTLANLSSLDVMSQNDEAPMGCIVDVVDEAVTVHLKLEGTIMVEAKLEKLKKKMGEVQKQCDALVKKTSASSYQEKAPPHVREADESKLASLLQSLASLKEAEEEISASLNSETNPDDA